MKNVIQNLEGVVEQIGDLADTKVAIWKLKATHTVNNYLSNVIGVLLLIFLLLVAALFLGFGLAFYLGQLFNSTGLGFLITGAIFIVLGFFFFLLRKKVFPRLLHHSLLQMVFKEDAGRHKSPEEALSQMLEAEQVQKQNIKKHMAEAVKDVSYMYVMLRLMRSGGKMVASLFNKINGSEERTKRNCEGSSSSDIKKIITNTLWSTGTELLLNLFFSGKKKAKQGSQ